MTNANLNRRIRRYLTHCNYSSEQITLGLAYAKEIAENGYEYEDGLELVASFILGTTPTIITYEEIA